MSFSDNLVVFAVMLIVEIPLCVVFVFLALLGKAGTDKGDCTVLVRGVISGVQALWGKHQRSYFPVYQYEYMGVLYEKTSPIPSGATYAEAKEKVGTEIEIYVNPEDPEKYFCPKDARMNYYLWIICLCVAVLVILGCIAVDIMIFLT